MMDAVYPLGNGSLWNNNEIRYSIASLRRFAPFIRDIYTVGETVENTYHIQHEETQHPAVNIWEKVYIACHNSSISERFMCINDDHFLLKEIPEDYPAYYSYNIKDYPIRSTGVLKMEHPYNRLVRRTRELLGDVLFYNVHCPFIVDKSKFITTFERYEKEIYEDCGILVKTTYLAGTQGMQMNDYKTRINEPYESVKQHCSGRHIFSTDTHISDGAIQYLAEIFPEVTQR